MLGENDQLPPAPHAERTPEQDVFLTASGDLGLAAMDELPDVFFFVKDVERRFVYWNAAFLTLMGLTAAEVVGRRDEDLSPGYLVEHYREDDLRVLTTGARLVDIVELVHNVDGSYDWFTTTKFPVCDGAGAIIGVAGITRNLTKRAGVAEQLLPLTPAIELISREYHRSLSIAELASAVSMSPSHFARLFKRHFGTSPHKYLRGVRLIAACDLLCTTDDPVSTVATRTGYYDHSHLTNELVRAKGMTPSDYRARYRRVQAPRRQVVRG
jgi:PAS domain S-box-containing protein